MIFISFSEKITYSLADSVPACLNWHPALSQILKYSKGLFPQFSCHCFRDPDPSVVNPDP